jgi:hypothetical protein
MSSSRAKGLLCSLINLRFMYACLSDVKLPKDDLTKIETCRSVSEL